VAFPVDIAVAVADEDKANLQGADLDPQRRIKGPNRIESNQIKSLRYISRLRAPSHLFPRLPATRLDVLVILTSDPAFSKGQEQGKVGVGKVYRAYGADIPLKGNAPDYVDA